MTLHKNVSGNLLDLADGSLLEPGAEKELSAEQVREPHNKDLIKSGQIVKVSKEGGEK